MPTEIQIHLEKLLAFRTEYEETIRERLVEIEHERKEINAEYDEEVAELHDQLKAIGVNLHDPADHPNPTDLGRRMYGYLEEKNGELVSSTELRRQFKTNGAIPVILAPYIREKKIELVGKSWRRL